MLIPFIRRMWGMLEPAPALANLPVRRPTRLQIGLWAGLMAAFLALTLHGYSSIEIGAMKDDAAYILLARSLVFSDSYSIPTAAVDVTLPKYPFAYPLVLSGLVALFPQDLEVLRLPSLFATLANGALLFWGWPYFSRWRSHWWALAVTGLYLLSPLTVGQARVVMSEAVFTLFFLIALYLVERLCRTQPRFTVGLLLGVVLTGVIFTRSAGLFLLPALGVALWAVFGRRAWAALAGAAASLVVTTALVVSLTPVDWRALPRFVTLYSGDLTERSITMRRVPTAQQNKPAWVIWSERINDHVVNDLRGLVIPVGGGQNEAAFFARLGLPSPMPVVCYLMLAVILLGLGRWLLQERLSVGWLYTTLYGLVLVAWVWRGQRLMYPIVPHIFFALLLGVEGVLQWAGARWRALRWAQSPAWVAGTALLLMALAVVVSLRVNDSHQHLGSLTERTAWARANLPADSRILTEEPLIDLMYGSQPTVQLPKPMVPADHLEGYMVSRNTRYILLAAKVDWQVDYQPMYSPEGEILREHLEAWEQAGRVRLVYTSADRWIQIYEVTIQ